MLLAASGQFTWIDWSIVIGYMVFTTWLGARMAGKQSTMRDFFLGGRKLPWYAVSGSIIATEISALTFIIVPFIVFRPGGNFTYLQLGVFGTLFARIIVGYVLVPAYYKREIYSPYDYMGNQLGGNVRTMTTSLFALGGILAQSARVYLTAVVLGVILHSELAWMTAHVGLDELSWAIMMIGVVAIIWTLIGGIATVIWTDVMLFLLFLVGAIVALGTIAYQIPGGLAEIFREGWNASDGSGEWGKFTFFDLTSTWPAVLTSPYTIWAAVIAATWGSVHPYGCDQLLVQRVFCCKNEREARWAVIASTSSQVVTFVVALVGVGLYAYYLRNPLTGDALAMYEDKPDRIFPIFIMYVIPTGFKGLIIAGVMAAAVSSLTSILAALSQTVMSAFYAPLRTRRLQAAGMPAFDGQTGQELEDRHSVFVGRMFVVGWGVILCLVAYLTDYVAARYPTILDLGLAMAGFAGGALLAGFFLAFLPLKIDGRGFMWSGPMSVLYVFALAWHEPWSQIVCWIGCSILLLTWIAFAILGRKSPNENLLPMPVQTIILLLGVAGMLWLNIAGHFQGAPDESGNPTFSNVAWPWYVPLGSTVAFTWGYLLARRRTELNHEDTKTQRGQ